MVESKNRPLREIKYPPTTPKEEAFTRLHELPDEKKFDYRYWERFLSGHKRNPWRWQMLLIPVLILAIVLLYRAKFHSFDNKTDAPKESLLPSAHPIDK